MGFWRAGLSGLGCHLGYTDQSRSQSVIDRPLKDRPPKPTAMADAANGPLPGEASFGLELW